MQSSPHFRIIEVVRKVATMSEALEGVIHGKTIELATDPGLVDGQAVQVIVRPLQTPDQRRDAILRTAGSMANTPDFDAAMARVHADRRSARYRETVE